MQRKDVERLARTCSETGHNHVMSIEVPRVLRYLIDRAEKAEAERDAAFAAGQTAVVDWLDGFDTTGWDDREAIWAIGWVAELVRKSLPIKPRP